MSKSNALRSDISPTYFAEACTAAGVADPTQYARLKYLTAGEVKAMAVEDLTWEYTTPGVCETTRVRGWAETSPRGVRKFYVRRERV